jgi:small-conductance mechanosensitive channel
MRPFGPEDLVHYAGLVQVFAIGITGLVGWFVGKKVRRYFEDGIKSASFPHRILLKPAHFSVIIMQLTWCLMLWFSLVLYKHIGISVLILHGALTLVFSVMVLSFALFYIQNWFMSRFVILLVLTSIVLRFFDLWTSFEQLLGGMSITVGHIEMSILAVGRAFVTFTVFWSMAILSNNFFGFLLSTSSRMTYSDQVLAARAIKTANTAIVILITLASAGIHPAALAVTGGAIGFSIGVGLQKIGSNLVSGITLLIRKPVTQGNWIMIEKPCGGGSYLGRVESMGLLYVHVVTRDAIEELIPNEIFMTHKIVNISHRNNLIRLHLPFGISYHSDVNKAIDLAVAAAKSIGRVLGNPEPKCLLKEFGQSTVNLELRLWIHDPEHGITSVKSSVYLAMYHSFHENNIELPLPQRDLHIKSAVPLRVSGEGNRKE